MTTPAASTGAYSTSGPLFSGTGWKTNTRFRTYCISPSQQFTVTFPTSEFRARYVPYLTVAIDQLVEAGVPISIGGIEPVNWNVIPARGHIQYGEVYRPIGTAGMSQGVPCYNTADNSVWGGYVRIDSEYWDGSWSISDTVLRNALVHELGHALGLDHPNTDLNSDGTVASYEAVKDPSIGYKPLMTSPNGGYQDSRAGQLTPYDLNGFRQMLANARTLGVS